jgi:hypothetical protein
MITLAQYFMGRDATHAADLTPDIIRNATDLVEKVNRLIERIGAAVTWENDPDTRSLVSSGWRPPAINAATRDAAKRSKHMAGLAVDLYDPDGDLDDWLLNHLPAIGHEFGLYLEHPSATKGWAHLQSVPPGSGRRVFYP